MENVRKYTTGNTMGYTLFKNPIQKDTLAIVQYLQNLGYNFILPAIVIERNHPYWVTSLPSIATETERYVGLKGCVEYYEKATGVENLLEKAIEWKKANEHYHCRAGY